MKYLIGLFISAGIFGEVCAQSDSLSLSVQRTLEAPDVATFRLDGTGNAYTLNTEGTIVKYDVKGQKRAQFSQNRFGTLKSINTQNPLKILAWYADFRTVVMLDRSLTQLGGALNLVEQGYPEVYAVAPAADGNLWAFDEVGFRLRKLDAEGNQVYESQDLNLLLDQRVAIREIIDNGEHVIAADTAQGLLVFDVFGQFQSLLPLKDLTLPLHLDGHLMRWIGTDGTLREVNLLFPATTHTWQLPAAIKTASTRQLLPDGIAVERDGKLEIWKQ
jgi:hypothetical protein